MEEFNEEMLEPQEKSEAIVVFEDDPEQHLAVMKKRAMVASQLAEEQDAILVATTSPSDWVKFGDQMRLSSVGAEKVARNFGIKLTNWNKEKEEFRDAAGPGYVFTYSCDAELGGRKLHAQGICSTRDKFLCKKGDEWRPLEDININNIMQAAYHRCQGNAIKAVLGIRSVHIDRWKQLFQKSDIDAEVTKEAQFKSGGSGGTKPKKKPDANILKELTASLMELAGQQKQVDFMDNDEYRIIDSLGEPVEIASQSLKALTTFVNDKGEVIEGKTKTKDLSGGQAYYAKKKLDKLTKGQ